MPFEKRNREKGSMAKRRKRHLRLDPKSLPPHAVVYCRVSSAEQADNYSIPKQERECRAYNVRHNLTTERVFIDPGESATTVDRPKFKEMLDYLRKNRGRVGYVVVWAASRFSRFALDFGLVWQQLTECGVGLRSVTEPIDETPIGVFSGQLSAALAELDNSNRAVQSLGGMRSKVESGGWAFRTPLGYVQQGSKRESRLVFDSARAPLVRQAFELIATGLHSQREVLDQVTTLGLRTRLGQPVPMQTFHSMLRNPLYAGWIVVKTWNARVRGNFEPIVDETLFLIAQEFLDGRRKTITPYERNRDEFPLRTFVECGKCGTPITGYKARGHGGVYSYYKCRRKGCGGLSMRAEKLDAAFASYCDRLRVDTDYLMLFKHIAADAWRDFTSTAHAQEVAIEKRLRTSSDRRQRIIDLFVDRQLTADVYGEQLARVDVEIATDQQALAALRYDAIDADSAIDYALGLAAAPGQRWQAGSLPAKQRLQQVFFPKRLQFEDGEFRTSELGFLFKHLRANRELDSRLVAHTGFEPVLPP